MKNILKFNKVYFILTISLLVVEILIATYAHDRIIRPYVGDLLVVILLYCFVRSFLNTPVLATSVAVLLFAYMIETLQYFTIVNKLGLQNSSLARTVIGTSFEWIDIVAYTCGAIMVIIAEKIISEKRGGTTPP